MIVGSILLAFGIEAWWDDHYAPSALNLHEQRWQRHDGAARHLIPTATRAHTVRHTFAARHLAAHAQDLVGLAAMLGHSSLNTTRIYVQPTAEQLADRVERIDLNAYAD